MKKRMNKLTAMLVTLVLVASLMPAAMAVQQGTVDLAKEGDITVTLKYGETPVSGIDVTLYRVATGKVENNNLFFEVVDALGPMELDGLTAEETAQATTDLVAKIRAMTPDERACLIVDTKPTNEEGAVKFEDLSVGAYLAVQGSNSSYTFSPVLMYLPYTFRDDAGAGLAWEFAVTANPKVSYSGGGGGGGPTTPDPEDPPVIIIPDDPPPLTPGETPGETPDEPLEEIPEEDVPLAVLPQTGLLQWPIPVMGAAGLLLIALGLMSEQKRKAQNN